MTDKPILFSGSMVRAILREIEAPGTGKSQTRRVLKFGAEPPAWFGEGLPTNDPAEWAFRYYDKGSDSDELRYLPDIPSYAIGDRLWVKHSFDVFPVYFMPIAGYEGLYSAGTDGVIYRVDGSSPSPLKGSPTGDNKYLSVSLSRNGVWHTFSVHSLIATAFYGEKPFDDAQVRHLNNEKFENRPQNLCWGTMEENWTDRRASKAGIGESHHNVRLSEQDVEAIRLSSASQRSLAKQYGVAQSTIWAVKAGKNWRYPEPAPPSHKLFKPWRSSMFMPKWASRITLLVTDVRVQRLQEIDVDDVIDEGVYPIGDEGRSISADDTINEYRILWDSLNAKRDGGDYAWAKNPWVAAYSFKPFAGNIDQIEVAE